MGDESECVCALPVDVVAGKFVVPSKILIEGHNRKKNAITSPFTFLFAATSK